MPIHRFGLSQALRALGNAEMLVGPYNSAALSVGVVTVPPPVNTGNGTFGAITGKIRGPSSIVTLIATSATNFTVNDSVVGALGNLTVGTPYVSSVFNGTLTAGGVAFVAGDHFTITMTGGAWLSLGAKEGPITESGGYRLNELKAEELTGGIPHQATVVLEGYTITVPIIAGDDNLWAKISPLGTKDMAPDSPADVITTSGLLVPRDLIIEPGGLSYDGAVWSPAAPDNRLVFIPRMYMTPGDISRPFDNGGKSIVEVTMHPMWFPAGPPGKRLYVRGDPVAAGYTDFRL
jgi:hypothetical protein